MIDPAKKTCPVCDAPSPLAYKHPDADLYRCPSCDHCFSDVSTMKAQENYGAEYYEVVHKNWFENPNIALFDWIFRRILLDRRGASVIDVGCGRGDLLQYIRKLNPDMQLTGVDLSPNKLTDGIEFVQGDAMSFGGARKFDVVINTLVIEHVADLHAFTESLKNLCKHGGLCIITTINERSVLYETARAMSLFGMKGPFTRLYEKHHLNHFNVDSLRELMRRHNLEIEKTELHNIPMAAVDFDASSSLSGSIQRAGVWGTFVLGKLTGKTFLQTVACRRD